MIYNSSILKNDKENFKNNLKEDFADSGNDSGFFGNPDMCKLYLLCALCMCCIACILGMGLAYKMKSGNDS